MRTLVNDLWHDTSHAFRLLRSAPGFAAAAVAVLALGIGASTAMFAVVDAVLLRPLPFPAPERLVMLRPSSGSRLSAGYLHDWRVDATAFADLAGWHEVRANLTGAGAPREVIADRVTPNFFSMLGAPPIAGRTLTHERTLSRVESEVVLSHGLWQRQFGGDPAVVGRALTLDGERLTIVGVMPAGFTIRTTELAESRAELWVPLALRPGTDEWTGMGGNLHVVGRLAPGASLAQARTQLTAIAARIEIDHPSYSRDWTIGAIPLLEATVMDVRRALIVLFGGVGLLLLIACANVANLIAIRATKRQPELAVRRALGATSARLARQFAVESLVLATAGGALGLALAAWGTTAVLSNLPAGLDLPRIQGSTMDWRILGFATIAAALSALLAGVAPVVPWLLSARAPAGVLTARESSPTSRGRLSGALIALEVALAIVLLAGAGLLVRSFMALNRVDPGYAAAQVITMRTTLPAATYATDEHVRRFGGDLLDRVTRLREVSAAGTINYLPLSRFGAALRFQIDGRPDRSERDQKFAWVSVVGGRYFDAMGIPLLRGRLPGPDDRDGTPAVFVIDAQLATRFWPDQDPIGARLVWDAGNDQVVAGTIVGVVGSVHWRGLAAPPEPTAYFWFPQAPRRDLTVVARTVGPPADAAGSMAAQVALTDARQPVSDIRLMDDLVAADLAQPRFTMLLLAGFAAAALLLAAVGVYGAIAFSTAQRRREIGIRIALGAQRPDVLWYVLQDGARLATIGVVAGLAAALALGRLMSGLLYGVTATDPLTLACVAAAVSAIALLATYVPARRATRIDPAVALAE